MKVKKKQNWKQLVSMLLVAAMLCTSISIDAFAAEPTEAGTTAEENEQEQSTEEAYSIEKSQVMEEESTTDSTTYDIGNGKKLTEFYSQDVRFENKEGELVDYDASLTKVKEDISEHGASLESYAYENKAGDKKQYFPEQLTEETPILMEYGAYQIRLRPVTEEAAAATETEEVTVEKETVTDIYEEEQTVPTKAVYTFGKEQLTYQYTSTDIGVKEEIVLEKEPESNVFRSILEIPGLTIRKNALDEGFTIYDGDEMVAGIEAPSMNDASGEAYSEALTCKIQTLDEEEGIYEMIVEADASYLNDAKRQYPVTIDPTLTWSGNSKIADTYVISGSTYKNTNFYDSGITGFNVGKISQGTSRAYLVFASLSALHGRYVESAKLVLTECSGSKSGQTIHAYRVIEDWTKSKITWANKAAYQNTSLSSFKTSGKAKKQQTLNLTKLFQGYAKKSYSNYGIVLKNASESSSYGKFFGSRVSTTSYRPKLTVVHYDSPTTPTAVTVTPRYLKPGKKVKAAWEGISSQSLASVQYALYEYDAKNAARGNEVIAFSSSTKIGTSGSGSATIAASANWQEGAYALAVRGVDSSGIAGKLRWRSIYIDGTAPTMDKPTIEPATTADTPTDNLMPVLTWKNAKDTYFSKVECKVDNGNYVSMGTTASGTYTIPEGTIEANGEHTITVRAVDKAGNTKAYTLPYYVEVKDASVEAYLPKEDSLTLTNSYGKNTIAWKTEKALSESVYYRIYRGEEEAFQANEDTLFADQVMGTYWTDIASVGTESYYYKLAVVRTKADGSIEKETVIDGVLKGEATKASALQKRTGSKEYLGYYSFSTPIGNGTVENSTGNLSYSQEDASVTENQLTADVTRTYNSQMELKGMFGQGWMDSLHQELLQGEDGTLYLVSGDGSIYTFKQGSDGYECTEGKNYELKEADETATLSDDEEVEDREGVIQQAGVAIDSTTMGTVTYKAPEEKKEEVPVQSTTETGGTDEEEDADDEDEEEASVIQVTHAYTLKNGDGCLYRFNAGGQLVAMLEPNGTFLLYLYDEAGRLASVQTQHEKKLTFVYEEDSERLKRIQLPDETILSYTYTDGQLTKVAHNSSDAEDAESVSNSYGYGDEGLESITDRKKNTYEVTYEGEKAVGVSYPQDSEIYKISYKDQETSVSKKTLGGAVLYTTSVKYDAETGKTLQETDADGNVTSYTYGNAKNPYLVTKTIRTVGYEELKNGTVSFATVEKISETTYNEEEQVTEELEEDGTLTKYTYGKEGEWTEELPTEVVSTRKGETISHSTTSYDTKGNVVEEQDVTDSTNEMLTKNSYDAAGNLTESVTKEAGLQTSAQKTEYDKLGNIVEEKETSGEVVSMSTNTYDAMGRVLTTTDASTGEVTAYTYDYLGREVKTETTLDGKTQTTSASYDANGTVTSEIDADGVKTKYIYDSMNRVAYRTIVKDQTAAYKMLYTYEDVTIWDGRGTQTILNAYAEKEIFQDGTFLSEKYYDGSGRLVKEKAGGIYTDYVYDQSGNQVVSCKNGTDADAKDGCVNLTLYDEEGREYATIQNAAVSGENYSVGTASVVTQKTYDTKGNVKEEIDANGVVTSYTYDDSSRVTEVVQDVKGMKVSTKASYETDTEKETTTTSITDAKGHVSEEIQDAAGLTTATKDLGDNDEESIGTSYAYDSKGNKVKEIYESGAYKTFEYDDRNLLTATKTFTAEEVQTLQSEYTYDDKYRLTETIDSKAEDTGLAAYRYSYTGYDAYGRTAWTAEVNSKEEPTETQIEEHKIHYTYDAEDKVTAIAYAMATAENVQGLQFVYDSNRWLSEVQAVVGESKEVKTLRTYKYGSYGNVIEIKEYPDFATKGATCITKQYLYNDLDQVVEMTYQNGSKVLETYAYAYDKNGNVIQETEVNNTPETEAYQVNETKDYTYDSLGRLVKTVVTDYQDAEKQVTTTYEYDEVGNRQKKTTGSTEIQYTYNGLDQLLKTETTCGGAGAGTVTYTYDENGNQVKEVQSKTQTTIVNTYDEENRLSKVIMESPAEDGSTKTFTQENLYNGEGQRIQKKEGAAVTDYYYQDGVVSYTTDGSDTEKVIQNLLGLEGNIISAETVSQTEEDGTTYRYHLYNKDIQGSTTSIIDETGKGELSYEYDEFGETTIHGGSGLANEVCYTGGIYDEGTGLYYLNARYYDPITGRFLTEDTYRGESGEVADWHLYAYCANDPINYVDPSGHMAVTAYSLILLVVGVCAICAYMSTTQFKIAWTNFCKVAGNGLSRLWKTFIENVEEIYSWSKGKINKVAAEVEDFKKIAKANVKIRTESRKKKYKYFSAWLGKAGKARFVTIGGGLTSTKAVSRVSKEKDVFAVSKQYAYNLAKKFGGVVGPEIDKGKENVLGYYYHYHVQKRKNKAHIWYWI